LPVHREENGWFLANFSAFRWAGLFFMAGDWIKVRMAAELGIDVDSVAGKLLRVWAWASRNCNADGVTSVTVRPLLDRYAGVTSFTSAMIKVGWLKVEGDVLTFPNFDRHCSQTAKERANSNRRVALHRYKCNADTVTNVTEKPLPEKRREESNTPIVPTPTVDHAADIYAAYPRKVGRDAALKAIKRAMLQLPVDALKEATEAFAKATAAWPAEDRQYIPHPATWYNQGRYADDRANWMKSSPTQTNQGPRVRTISLS
jgi:hypothetical protein